MLLNDIFLVESQNYENMFSSILSLIEKENPQLLRSAELDVKDNIEWAKKKLKKNDRIVWFLRYARLCIAYEYIGEADIVNKLFNNDIKIINNDYFIFNKDTPKKIYYGDIDALKIRLEHYLSLPVYKIQNSIFGKQTAWDLFEQFNEYEKEWKQNRKGKIPLNDDHDYEIIKKLPDDWYWVLLNRHYCELEADAMGHCGNQPGHASDVILSLRKLINIGNEKYWEPHLTFILDEYGYLGEMKGRGNEKPAAKYHPYIIELLKLPIIKGIIGGGYLSENNFSMDDLTASQKEKLIKEKPSLGTILDQYKSDDNTLTDDLLIRIQRKYKQDYKRFDNGFVGVFKFAYPIDFIEDNWRYIENIKPLHFMATQRKIAAVMYNSNESCEKVLENLPKRIISRILKIINKNFDTDLTINNYKDFYLLDYIRLLHAQNHSDRLYTILKKSAAIGIESYNSEIIGNSEKLLLEYLNNLVTTFNHKKYRIKLLDESGNIIKFGINDLTEKKLPFYFSIPDELLVLFANENVYQPYAYASQYIINDIDLKNMVKININIKNSVNYFIEKFTEYEKNQ